MQHDAKYMTRALELAERGKNTVNPNPLVGAVIVKNDQVIGEGAHEVYGGPHAEINAIKQVSASTENATMYVNLEPCTYDGKTPPCVPEIIEAGISRVVIGIQDPNPRVDGKGIRLLAENGIDVSVGVLEEKARALNRGFIRVMQSGIPWVTLKLAMTMDGFIADTQGKSQWITGDASRKRVHRWRSDHNAVLVGSGTVLVDDPKLTVRTVPGKNPTRVVLDPEGAVPSEAHVLQSSEAETVLLRASHLSNGDNDRNTNVDIFYLPTNQSGEYDWQEILTTLYEKKGVLSVFIEGGAEISSSLLDSGYVDELILMTGSKIIGQGLSPFHRITASMDTPHKFELTSLEQVGNDICARYRQDES